MVSNPACHVVSTAVTDEDIQCVGNAPAPPVSAHMLAERPSDCECMPSSRSCSSASCNGLLSSGPARDVVCTGTPLGTPDPSCHQACNAVRSQAGGGNCRQTEPQMNGVTAARHEQLQRVHDCLKLPYSRHSGSG